MLSRQLVLIDEAEIREWLGDSWDESTRVRIVDRIVQSGSSDRRDWVRCAAQTQAPATFTEEPANSSAAPQSLEAPDLKRVFEAKAALDDIEETAEEKRLEAYRSSLEAYMRGASLGVLAKGTDLSVPGVKRWLQAYRQDLPWDREAGANPATWTCPVGDIEGRVQLAWTGTDITARISLCAGDNYWSTDNPEDWPLLDRFIPKRNWPLSLCAVPGARAKDVAGSWVTPLVSELLGELWGNPAWQTKITDAERKAMQQVATTYGVQLSDG